MGMRVAVVLGPDERASGQVAIKDLRSGEQSSYPQAEAAKIIRQMLQQSPT
jgi:histidyl-tRNA synthetase